MRNGCLSQRMGSESEKPHIVLFPFMAHGHMIPMVDIAKLFASRNLKTTILTTPLNEPLVSRQIQKTPNSDSNINLHILKFPIFEAGLPEGCENVDFISSKNLGWEILSKFLLATPLFKDPLEEVLREINPDCLVADWIFPWATDSASKFDSEPFVVPSLPGDMKLSRNKLLKPELRESETDEIRKLYEASIESELKSFGVVVNSFFELEPVYAEHYRNVLGRRAWSIGPVSLCNRDVEEQARRGNKSLIDEHECSKWLDSMKPDSVVYLCFGSTTNFKATQLKEIAIGLEASRKDFIWVVRTSINLEDDEDWLPEGFEERMEGKGLIIRGWAPQVVILEHEAIGGFVTHCGWNSTLEGIVAGLPMVTWPIGSEQFFNEKFVTEVLKIGVSIGVHDHSIIKSEYVEKAINQIMEGEEMRRKAHELGQIARMAVEEGGSSYSDLNVLIDELVKLQS
ncbi:scopoletin glucosyltransferase-like isoform X2 [Euphorbia lathyris]|uniref:scopoletin glucosyltransferase-like isoform X2 n=1 Tax=Euphorbia lathyris TaxID=212925 RepID=UPI0033143272